MDVRVIASTNKNLDEALQQKQMREDLYYRLNVFHIQLPPLRERPDDVLPTAEALIRNLNKKHECRVVDLDGEVADRFRRYSWPGNARELRNVLERAVILAGEGAIRPCHRVGGLDGVNETPAAEQPSDPNVVSVRVGTTVREGEKALIFKTLEHTSNNKTRAARILDISLKTLHNKLKDYNAQ